MLNQECFRDTHKFALRPLLGGICCGENLEMCSSFLSLPLDINLVPRAFSSAIFLSKEKPWKRG